MSALVTHFDLILANTEQMDAYYTKVTKRLNDLLDHYKVLNLQNELDIFSVPNIKTFFSAQGFFGDTPLKPIFFDHKKAFIPAEITQSFRNIITHAPDNVKAQFFEWFITLLKEKGWESALIDYFRKKHQLRADDSVIVEDIQNFSLGTGVYNVTFYLRDPKKEKITLFMKGCDVQSTCNELLYFTLQKALLPTAYLANVPCSVIKPHTQEALLFMPGIPGIASDVILSRLTNAHLAEQNTNGVSIIHTALEILIDAFMSHAALGDLLGRNDRHLMNSFIAVKGDLTSVEDIHAYSNDIVSQGISAISLIDIDLQWLLLEDSTDWMLADIDCGLAELNLFSLLKAFNVYDANTDLFFNERKNDILRYFTAYRREQARILEQQELFYSAIQEIYPQKLATSKINILRQRINVFANSPSPVIKLFERYLLNFRARLVHKHILIALLEKAKRPDQLILSAKLQQNGLINYQPASADENIYASSVSLQLQCFRGVSSLHWAKISTAITEIAKQFDEALFIKLQNAKKFIQEDTAALLKLLQC